MFWVLTGSILLLPSTCWGFTPDSPAVVAMVRRAAAYLETASHGTIGGRCLIALALLKANRPTSHPLVVEAIKDCQAVCMDAKTASERLDIYEMAVAVIFLCELSPSGYAKEVGVLIDSLEQRQKPGGGWGYPRDHIDFPTGDTSMTQYAILCYWVAQRSGAATVSVPSIERVCNWLIRTQDRGGAWGYQGRDPGLGNYERVPQEEVRHSLSAAGLGSVYVCANLLGLTSDLAAIEARDEELPAALKPVIVESSPRPRPGDAVEPSLVRRAMRDGNNWFNQNYRIDPPEWTLYYLYTLERYRSFRELAEGRVQREPGWYNAGVKFLGSEQQKNGSWNLHGAGDAIDTAFAILFLQRSTQKAIQHAAEELGGRLTGGRGLPVNTASVRVKDGKIVRTPFQGTADALLAILEDVDSDLLADEAVIDISSDPTARANQLRRLRRLTEAESYNVRIAAVKALASVRELDNVPALIFALGDPDPRVVREAYRGLMFISRKFPGRKPVAGAPPDRETVDYRLSDDSTEEQRQRAIEAWKKWYSSIRPDARFLN